MIPVIGRTHTTAWLCVSLMAIGLLVIPATLLTHGVGDTLVWINLTESAPRGIYVAIDPQSLAYGSYVLFLLPEDTHELIATWGWPPDALVLKQVYGLPGDMVCINGTTVFMHGEVVAHQLTHDHVGRSLPRIHLCHPIKENEFFALSTYAERSFDGRYFGVLSQDTIRAVVRPLWLYDSITQGIS